MRTFTEFDSLWAERHVAAQLDHFGHELRAALAAAPAECELQWRNARLNHFRAMKEAEAGDANLAAALFRDAKTSAEKALKSEPENVAALMWAGACGLEAARTHGPLRMALTLPASRQRLKKAAEISPAFHYAGPLRVLGRIAHLTPGFLGGNTAKSLDYYKRALKLAPQHPTTMLYVAEALISAGRFLEARKTLTHVLEAAAYPDWIWEQERYRRSARSLLHQVPDS